MRILLFLLRAAGVLLVIYIALVLYLNMRKENILSFAYNEIEIKKDRDTIQITGYRLGCAKAKEYADSLAKENIPGKLQLIDPIYSEKDYLRRRYGIFYPKP